jgi:hypothetical protein
MADSVITVVMVVAVLGIFVGVLTLFTNGPLDGVLGRGGLDTAESDRPVEPLADERAQEIRQMLGARNARRERRGLAPQDLDAELAALLRSADEDGLRDELRAVVEARNRRRARSGLQALDLDAEIERRLRDLN